MQACWIFAMRQLALAYVLVVALLDDSRGSTGVAAIDPITRRGKYLYNPSGERFYIKGVAYQEAAPIAASTAANEANGGFPEPDSFVDPLSSANAASCTHDTANLRDLGANTVRVYSVNATLDHDECMRTLSDAGIYVILDLSLPLSGSINRAAPSWDTSLLNVYLETIDAFARYDNVLAFNIGNEVVTQASNTQAAPFIKAAARDVKAYLRSQGHGNILVSYASTDGEGGSTNWRDATADYLTCGADDVSIDLYGLNSYAWCGNSTYDSSGYAALTQEFANLPVPSYFSEFGCVDISGGANARTWSEVQALFSAPMTDTWSGGVAFSYFQQAVGEVNYGLTSLQGSDLTLQPDWVRLKAQYANATPPTTPPTASGASSPAYAACVAERSPGFRASTSLPPTPDARFCNCLQSTAWDCLTTARAANQPAVIGALLGQACGYLASAGSDCAPIAANGSTGVYSAYSFCSPAQRLDWAMSAWYDSQDRNPQACNFANNATIAGITESARDSGVAAGACLAANPVGVRTPTRPDQATSTVVPGRSSGNGVTSGITNSAKEIFRCSPLSIAIGTIFSLALALRMTL